MQACCISAFLQFLCSCAQLRNVAKFYLIGFLQNCKMWKFLFVSRHWGGRGFKLKCNLHLSPALFISLYFTAFQSSFITGYSLLQAKLHGAPLSSLLIQEVNIQLCKIILNFFSLCYKDYRKSAA